jgi:hypothetical protein
MLEEITFADHSLHLVSSCARRNKWYAYQAQHNLDLKSREISVHARSLGGLQVIFPSDRWSALRWICFHFRLIDTRPVKNPSRKD